MINIVVEILGIIFLVAGIGVMTCATSPSENEPKAFAGYVVGTAIGVFGGLLIYSPIRVVYSWTGFDASVISVENGRVVPHTFAYWRKPNVYSIPLTGEVQDEKVFSCNAIFENRFGPAMLTVNAKAVSIPKFLDAYPQTSRLLVGSDVMKVISPSAWPCLKEWVKAGMPDGQAQNDLIHKYFDIFAEKGIRVKASFSFDSSVSSKKASSD